MKTIIILCLLLQIQASIDTCRQLTTPELCISSTWEQCRWMTHFEECMRSDNYLLGCDNTISASLCLKQIGTITGELAVCWFTTYCQTIPDLYVISCQDPITKSGCLSITNPKQLCQWRNNKCEEVPKIQLASLNSNFVNYEYSASVCPLITGYLIMHHTVLWPLVSYEADLITEADNLVKQEAGITVEITKTYDEGNLLNNYVDINQNFIWYEIRSTKSNTATNLKLNDKSRQGCIALEILSDSEFVDLFKLVGVVRGVNHIYCRYMTMNPYNVQTSIFAMNECRPVTIPQLRDQVFISTNQIGCTSMGRYLCQRFMNLNGKCSVIPPNTALLEKEFPCADFSAISQSTISSCTSQGGKDVYYLCALAPMCYMNTTGTDAVCTNTCSTFTTSATCIADTTCKWNGAKLGNITTQVVTYISVCVPIDGCDTLGLSKTYCIKMSETCYWNDTIKVCKLVTNLATMKCVEANTLYTCTMITRQDQNCIWFKEACINQLEQSLFSYFKSFPDSTIMNRNLCVTSTGGYFKYNYSKLTCDSITSASIYCLDQTSATLVEQMKIEDLPCTNIAAQHINKELCLNLQVSATKWNQYTQSCLNLTVAQTKLSCSSQKLVNVRVCGQSAVSSDSVCLSSDWNCIVQLKTFKPLRCNDIGLDKNSCLNIDTPGEHCMWTNATCTYFTYTQLTQIRCNALMYVNKSVCASYQNTSTCLYDSTYQSCYSGVMQESVCGNHHMNIKSCENSTATCYYDLASMECKTATTDILAKINCSGAGLSASACKSVTKSGQACYFDSTCQTYKTLYSASCTVYSNVNELTCRKYQTLFYNYFIESTYCQYNKSTKTCESTMAAITGCSDISTQPINVHRCIGQTSGNCYYDYSNQLCKAIDSTKYYDSYLLQNTLECTYANLQMCNKVVTPGQVCKKVIQNQNYKCIRLIGTTFTCDQLIALSSADMALYNPNVCALATDACLYDSSTSKCIKPPNTTTLYKCNTIGLSKTLCQTQSIGLCGFDSFACRYMTQSLLLTVTCDNLNKTTCYYGFAKCQYNVTTKLCSTLSSTCPTALSTTQSQYICATGNVCYMLGSVCMQTSTTNPCWWRQSEASCTGQTQYCQWVNSTCIEYTYNKCVDATSQVECIANKNITQYCVYDNNKCFSVTASASIRCNQFSYTSQSFCQQYPNCTYVSGVCQDFSYLEGSKQSFTGTSCSGECIIQRSNKCKYAYGSCQSPSISSCPAFDDYSSYSILACEQYTGCNFISSKDGIGICYKNTLTCESFSNAVGLCVLDLMKSTLKCYVGSGTCKSSTFTTCAQLSGLKVSRFTCESVINNNDCIYDSTMKQCKPIQFNYLTNCSATTLLGCAINTTADCIVTFSATANTLSTCTVGSNTFINSATQSNNLYGCTQLLTSYYYYESSTLKCIQLLSDSDMLIVSNCRYFNKLGCIVTSSNLNMSCLWDTNNCRQALTSDTGISCENLNRISCLSRVDVICQWVTDHCVTSPLVVTTCAQVNTGIYSPRLCANVTDKACIWNGALCEELLVQVQICKGLNKQACLNKTEIVNCIWSNNVCVEANLSITNCTDEISQTTCNNITNKACKWNGTTCITAIGTNCTDMSQTASIGCRNVDQSCIYNEYTNDCLPTSILFEQCLSTLSNKACRNVINITCTWVNGICELWTTTYANCTSVHNKYGCSLVDMLCQWDDTLGCTNYMPAGVAKQSKLCKDLPAGLNQKSCTYYNSDTCLFDATKWQCSYALRGTNISSLTSINQSSYTQPGLTGQCTQFLTLLTCISSRSQKCQWTTSCIVSTGTSCDNQNINGCLAITSVQCTWKDGTCLVWKSAITLTYSDASLVTLTVCQTLNVMAKYDQSTNSCVPPDLNNDKCSTDGINSKACVALLNAACRVELGGGCSSTIPTQVRCIDYVDVTYRVCQAISSLACKYVNGSCSLPESTDKCTTLGLSKLGCTGIKTTACIWDGTQCKDFIPNAFENQCDSKSIVNALACAAIKFERLPCIYDQKLLVCSPTFNPLSPCSTPGINRFACFALQREACSFTERCEAFKKGTFKCFQIQRVNARSCQALDSDTCAYDPINYHCYSIYSKVPCNQPGLNITACKSQEHCSWNGDDQQCLCDIARYVDQCTLTQDACLQSAQCTYQGGTCIRKYCEHLGVCTGIVNGMQCYLNQDNTCQGARKCEELVYLGETTKCSQYLFNGMQCVQTGKHCVSPSNLEAICAFDTECANPSCVKDNWKCRTAQCSDYSIGICQSKNNCAVINNKCQNVPVCALITDSEVCVQTTIRSRSCGWEEYKMMDTTMQCTDTWCEVFGASSNICNGNEITGKSCMINHQFQCKLCEQITDQCACNYSNGACLYMDGKCQSLLCSNYPDEETCTAGKKCYWSQQDKVCRKMCIQNIRQEQCDALVYECNWNPYMSICNQGKLTVPDLSVKIQVQDIESAVILGVLVMILLI